MKSWVEAPRWDKFSSGFSLFYKDTYPILRPPPTATLTLGGEGFNAWALGSIPGLTQWIRSLALLSGLRIRHCCFPTWGHSKKTVSTSQEEGSYQDLKTLAPQSWTSGARTVRNQCLLFQSPVGCILLQQPKRRQQWVTVLGVSSVRWYHEKTIRTDTYSLF